MSKQLEKERVKAMQLLAKLRSEATSDPSLTAFYATLMQAVWQSGTEMSSQQFVLDYCKTHNIEVRPNGIYAGGDLIRNHKPFFYRMHEVWRDLSASNNLKGSRITRDTIALEFEAILEEAWDKKRKDLRKSLLPIEDKKLFHSLLLQFTKAVVGKHYPDESSVDFRRAMAFIGHFLWQLQMKLHHGPNSVLRQGNESMLLLISRQQKTGKSTTVRRLLEPFNNMGFVWKTDFNRLEDQFSLQNLAYNYIAWFDDAGRASPKNMAKFKQIVTDDEVNFRAMYTQTEMRMPKLSTLIGTSNKAARELINDTTGLRRIHQIFVNPDSVDTGGGIDLDTLDSFDHTSLIRSTPLGPQASPLFDYITPKELREYEESTRPKHIIELWLNNNGYIPGGAEDSLKKTTDMYKHLCAWAADNGYGKKFTPTSESFRQKLLEMGFIAGRSKKVRGFYILGEEPNEL